MPWVIPVVTIGRERYSLLIVGLSANIFSFHNSLILGKPGVGEYGKYSELLISVITLFIDGNAIAFLFVVAIPIVALIAPETAAVSLDCIKTSWGKIIFSPNFEKNDMLFLLFCV